MEYTGPLNSVCPACGKDVILFRSHPVVYRKNEALHGGHLWCNECFMPLYRAMAMSHTEKLIESFQSIIHAAVVKAQVTLSDDYVIKGFWVSNFNNGLIGLVVNYSNQ